MLENFLITPLARVEVMENLESFLPFSGKLEIFTDFFNKIFYQTTSLKARLQDPFGANDNYKF